MRAAEELYQRLLTAEKERADGYVSKTMFCLLYFGFDFIILAWLDLECGYFKTFEFGGI